MSNDKYPVKDYHAKNDGVQCRQSVYDPAVPVRLDQQDKHRGVGKYKYAQHRVFTAES